jgi:hypothetical protein
MFEEQLEPRAEIVVARLAVARQREAILRTTAVAERTNPCTEITGRTVEGIISVGLEQEVRLSRA